MIYNVETPLNPHMAEQLGKEQAVARLTLEAWYKTLMECQPKHSIVLLSTEERESTVFGLSVRAYRFRFKVD